MLGFQSIAREYSRYAISQYSAASLLVNFIKINVPASKIFNILDVGCASGVNFDILMKSFNNLSIIHGLDISESMIEIAKLRYLKFKKIKLICGDIELFNSKVGYDLLFCNSMIYYVKNYNNFFNQCYSNLNPSGTLAIQYQTEICPQFINCFDYLKDYPKLVPYFESYSLPVNQPSYHQFEKIILNYGGFKINAVKQYSDIRYTAVEDAYNMFQSSAMIPFLDPVGYKLKKYDEFDYDFKLFVKNSLQKQSDSRGCLTMESPRLYVLLERL
ncbi:class I SAM-dependent methyltransferase [Thiotrichales bacterium 19X7-9]|nr:class I SAM-dependent methyltransferase [Thiotrichales bacterium 19X7-9]